MRKIELLVYRPIGKRPIEYELIADAIESAFSLTNHVPFKGTEPVFFGFKWETVQLAPKLTLIWNGIVKRLEQRQFLTPDGARFFPDEMQIRMPERKREYRAWMTFRRKGGE